jgi:hypothetical protein
MEKQTSIAIIQAYHAALVAALNLISLIDVQDASQEAHYVRAFTYNDLLSIINECEIYFEKLNDENKTV